MPMINLGDYRDTYMYFRYNKTLIRCGVSGQKDLYTYNASYYHWFSLDSVTIPEESMTPITQEEAYEFLNKIELAWKLIK
jgi:hypothetical protein